MTEINNKIIKEIAENLDCGQNCYYNFHTGDIITLPGSSFYMSDYDYESLFESDLKRIEEQKAHLIVLEPLPGFESFKIMEQFVAQVDNLKFRANLEDALQRRKPFQGFKYLTDNSDYRQSWFDFKQKELEAIVKRSLEREIPSK